ncbi:MAG TPA: bifunctional 5,10-methylenetetrahydrofolate dehydrogenase/5,10-methenyltetrahydrofolate cyclohydrolase [Acidimicrobiales bacterium]|nr:bifunctional 5,10-methylenetetrahydrofolate dehydrogenase/5,10-methenyltetrahydrofolate cyclohydrolase [Acidimicrobiales bacterium]
MSATIIDGTKTAAETRERVAEALRAAGSPSVTLATVLVGEDPPSQRYIRGKAKASQEVGITSRHTDLPATSSQAQVEDVVAALAADSTVHGILVQLPLPEGLDSRPVINLIPPAKDVDGLTDASLGRLVQGVPGHVGATPRGVMELLAKYEVPISGKRAVVIGRSLLVGLPVSLLLARKGVDATVTMAHSRTPDLVDVCRAADIIVAAAGSAHMITKDHVKPGAAVIDVGVSRTAEGIVGDVDFDAVLGVAGWLTPMPGGTGPMTIACLLENTLDAARMAGVLAA